MSSVPSKPEFEAYARRHKIPEAGIDYLKNFFRGLDGNGPAPSRQVHGGIGNVLVRLRHPLPV